MYNCIFTPHCTELSCDRSCPMLVETSYLLERNGISMNNSVFSSSKELIQEAQMYLEKFDGKLGAYIVSSNRTTLEAADLLTYCAICNNWQGSRLHVNVYNLRYSKYLEELKKSWSLKSEPDSLEYMQIWSESCKVLIVSNMDYVNFGDFESQTLLNLIQVRQSGNLTTILVVPPVHTLISTKGSLFFNIVKSKITELSKVVDQ